MQTFVAGLLVLLGLAVAAPAEAQSHPPAAYQGEWKGFISSVGDISLRIVGQAADGSFVGTITFKDGPYTFATAASGRNAKATINSKGRLEVRFATGAYYDLGLTDKGLLKGVFNRQGQEYPVEFAKR